MADAALGKLVVELSANVARFQQDMQSAVGIAEKSMAGITTAANAAKTALGFLGVGLSAAGLFAFVRGTADAIGALKTLSEQTGVSVESLSAMRTVAKYADTDMASVATGAQKLAKAMLEAQSPTTTTAKAFAAIGVATTETNGQLRASEAVMQDIGRVMGEMNNATERVALAQLLFGKSGAQLIPFLLDLGKAGELNAKITTEQAQAAKDFDDNLKRLTSSSQAWKVALVNGLIPSLNELLERLLKLKSLSLDQLLGRGGPITGAEYAAPLTAITELEKKLKGLKETRDALDPSKSFRNRANDVLFGDFGDLNRQITMLEGKLAVLRDVSAKDIAKLPPLSEPPGTKDFGLTGIGDKPEKEAKGLTDLERMVKSLTEEFNKADAAGSKLGEVARDLQSIKLQPGEDPKVALELGRKIDQRKQEQEQVKRLLEEEKKAYEGAGDVFGAIKDQRLAFLNSISGQEEMLKLENQMRDLVQGVLDGDISGEQFDRAKRSIAGVNNELEKLEQQIERINLLERTGFIDSDKANEQRIKAAKDYREALDKTAKSANDADAWARNIGLTFSSAFEDAITSAKKLGDIVNSLLRDIVKLATRELVTKPGGEALTGFLKTAGSALAGYFTGSGSTYGVQGGNPDEFYAYGGKRAAGGNVYPGMAYTVGEMGQEIFVPRTAGTIVPNSAIGGGTYYIDARGADQAGFARLENMIRSLNGSVERRAVAAVLDTKRRGGFGKAFA